jgi:hypothetical protein
MRSVIMAAILGLGACGQSAVRNREPEAIHMTGLLGAKAERDAQQALDDGDYRLLAVLGIGASVPGTDYSYYDVQSACGVRIIEGTSDSRDWLGDVWLNDNARAYAERYNQSIVRAAPRRCLIKNPPAVPVEPEPSYPPGRE